MMSVSTEKLAENPDLQKAKIWSNEEVAVPFDSHLIHCYNKAHSIHRETSRK